MRYYRVETTPVLGLDGEGRITAAITVLGRIEGSRGVRLHVGTWEAGRGQREDELSPAEFESWRRSFVVLTHES